LHFGEFGNNARDVLGLAKFGALHGMADTRQLYVCTLAMPFSTTAQRRAIHAELVQAYNPISQAGEPRNEYFEPSGCFEPPRNPEPRRRIGFLP
jgi:hypothetical protein